MPGGTFRFLPLLLGHVVVTWLVAQAFARSCYRGLLWLGIALNLASLGFFKYANFIADLVADLTGQVLPRSDILLPIGIAFSRSSASPTSPTWRAARRRSIRCDGLRCS